MLNIVLFGPPGAGKGTQSKKLTEKYQLVHLSTGDIFRANLQNDTELGLLARSYMDAGQLVPDDVTIQMLEAELIKNPYVKGYIFDGFPRNSNQAEALDAMLAKRSTKVNMMLALEVDEEELKNRLLLRGQESGRPDDQNPEVIQKRIDVYNSETAPVRAYYSAQNKYYGVNGIGEIDEIFNALCTIIESVGSGRRSEKNVPVIESVVIEEKVEESNENEVLEITRTYIQETVIVKENKNPQTIEVKENEVKQNDKPKKSKTVKPVVKKPASSAGGKAVKKTAAKSAAKKTVKKAAKKKVAPKKVAKKVIKKKVVKKVTKKPARPAGGKAVAKKAVSKKKVAPKKILKKKAIAKKLVKKIVKKKAVKKAAKKVLRKPVKKSAKPKTKKLVKKVSKKKKK